MEIETIHNDMKKNFICDGDIEKRNREKKMISDGKSLSGRNRLTDILESKIQRYYGMAIRNNINDLHSMKLPLGLFIFIFCLPTRALNMNCPQGINNLVQV
ncbi:hypothetical protein TNCV_1659221 [Trichonephila clavipes]|nr:hypothetical protein TNCV_1659221 [Trichonephila clavipes]